MPGVLVLSRVEEDQGFKVMLIYTISSRHQVSSWEKEVAEEERDWAC